MARYISDFRSASKENYKEFCREHPSIDISFNMFKDIIYKYNEELMKYALETGNKLSLPHGMGPIAIDRRKTKTIYITKEGEEKITLPINWVESKKQGKYVHYFNDRTEGWKFKWMWFKAESTNLKMKDIWCFKPARKWSLALRDSVLSPDKMYYKYTEWCIGRSTKQKFKNNA